MLKQVLAPINPDGWRFVAIFAVVSLILFWVWRPLGWLGFFATLWCLYFFRDPWRVTPDRPGLVVAPADGIVVAVDQAAPPKELGMGETSMLRVGIFLSVLDVHINRVPMAGRVKQLVHSAGKFLNAGSDKASEDNERNAICIATPEGADIAVVQIAGLIARRIVCNISEGQEVIAGQRFGLIRFGSRTDVYCPAAWTPLVIVGQHAIGGETVIADARGGETPRQGTVH